MRRLLLTAGVVALAAGLAGCGADSPIAVTEGVVLGPETATIEVDVRHSRFLPGRLEVAEGTLVQLVVHNTDPIDHELIVGPKEIHDRHEAGDEAEHGAVPGEVSVPAGATRSTTYRFTDPGTVVYACHLPRHLAYGMEGTVEVVPAP